MPPAIACVRGGALIAEPPNLWFCRDTNGDGKADEKIELASDYGDPKNPENNPTRAQWGLSQDDFGRLFCTSYSDHLRADIVPTEYTAKHLPAAKMPGPKWNR